ncbi:MAG: FtsX-like permease family protein [Streptosporangiaceae bacterium]
MSRLVWSQLRFRSGRALALLVGILVAATAFTVLTAAARTAQLRIVGTLSAHFRPAYDILVRPAGARSRLESATGTVQPDFLSGIYGGITMPQYHQIQHISGVQVAAPIAMVGYGFVNADFPVWLPSADVAHSGRQLYRATTTWVSGNGASQIRQPPTYVYVTPERVHQNGSTGATIETLPGGSRVTTCPAAPPVSSPFSYTALASTWCWSKIDGAGAPGVLISPDLGNRPGFGVDWQFPMLIAAIDPAAEARLDGLNHAVTSGQYLPQHGYGTGPDAIYFQRKSEFPVLAAADSGIGEDSVTKLRELATPAAPPVLNTAAMHKDAALPGHTVLSTTITARQAYQYLLTRMRNRLGRLVDGPRAYWSAGPVHYRRASHGDLVPVAVRNPVSAWELSRQDGIFYAPLDNAGTQYRTLRRHVFASGAGPPVPVLTGTFSQSKIAAFDPLSRVPLGPYQPTAAAPANAASRKALGGGDLLPSLNLGGYVSQPVQLLTTLAALPTLENKKYGDARLARAPISVIRVRVAGVTGPNPASLDRIKAVADQIEVHTHLTVDIVAGSSPAPATIALPAGRFGQPAVMLTEDWVKKGVAVTILDAVDRSSVTLFVLILVVCALFVANSATAAVRGRRQELGVLAALGWTRPRLFAVVLGEVAMTGLVAGILGALLAAALGLHASLARAALAIPVAVVLALVAGLVPAWLAARAEPVASVRPPVLAARRARQPSGITGLAVVNVLRTPGRTLVGALSLAVGVAALTLLVAVTLAFRGAVVGTLLGNVVTVQVRGVDYVAVAATVILGVLAVSDALLISINERAAELATIRTFGWPESTLRRLVITEGALTGIAGSVTGAVLGLAGAAVFAGQLPPLLFAAAGAAVAAGVLVTCVAALVPAHLLRRLPAAQLLAQE